MFRFDVFTVGPVCVELSYLASGVCVNTEMTVELGLNVEKTLL